MGQDWYGTGLLEETLLNWSDCGFSRHATASCFFGGTKLLIQGLLSAVAGMLVSDDISREFSGCSLPNLIFCPPFCISG